MKVFFSELYFELKKNRGAMLGIMFILFSLFIAFLAPILAPHNPTEVFPDALRLPPSFIAGGKSGFFFGTDDIGRDLLSRLIYGSRISLSVGFSVVILSLISGTFLGVISGFYGGFIDRSIMRLTDLIMSLPSILFAIVIVAVLGPGITNAIVAVSVVAIPNFIRIIRAQVMVEKNRQYVQAAKLFGAGNFRIMFVEILPNCMAPLIVQASLGFSDGILNVAALGFLGLGAQAPMSEWGTMLSDARSYIESSPWMVTLPGLCILLTVLSFNLLGDGLRDALDPRLKKQN
ncbi:MAG: ABC transporter permease subunit [Bacteriovorax sp.]|jgi:ABC-type dipeptide/oligopeptide/nickel transport system permease subunit